MNLSKRSKKNLSKLSKGERQQTEQLIQSVLAQVGQDAEVVIHKPRKPMAKKDRKGKVNRKQRSRTNGV